MDATSFAYWLHGFFEISDSNSLTEKQVQIIKDHLDLVFNKVTPDYSKENFPQTDEFVPFKPYQDNPVVPLTPYQPWVNPDHIGTNPYPWDTIKVTC